MRDANRPAAPERMPTPFAFGSIGIVVPDRLTVGAPGDASEREADRIAEALAEGTPAADVVVRPLRARPARPDGPLLSGLDGGTALPSSVRATLEPRLGYDLSSVRVHADTRAAGIAHALDARAFAIGHDIAFAAGEFQPNTRAGLALIAHEVVHTLQPGNAARLSRQVAAAKTPAADDSIKLTRAIELATIRGRLKGWWVSDGDVDKILRVLADLAGPVIVAVMAALDDKELSDYLGNLNSPHVRWRREVLESMRAIGPDGKQRPQLIADLDTDVIEDMDLAGLSVREFDALALAVRALIQVNRSSFDHILRSPNGPAIRRMVNEPDRFTPAERKASADADEKARGAEAKRRQEEKADFNDPSKPPDEQTLRDTSLEAQAKRAIKLLSGGDVAPVLAIFSEVYKTAPPSDDRDPQHPGIRALAHRLDRAGVLDDFVDKLPLDAFGGDRGKVVAMVLRYRPPFRNLAMAERLLSYGAIDWLITEREARVAYHVVKALPLEAQDRFRRFDHSEFFIRMERNLATDFATSSAYQGVEVARDPLTGNFVDRARDNARRFANRLVQQELASLLAKCEALNQARAAEVFWRLGALERQDAALIVRRLDALGHIERVLDLVGNQLMFLEENRRTTLRVMALRDPIHLAHHARTLLSYDFLDWKIWDAEADLAWYLVKSLPEDELRVFTAGDRGKWWGRLQSQISDPTRVSLGGTMYHGGRDGADERNLIAQLLDDKTWAPTSAARLDGVLRMARLASLGPRAFTESQRRYQDEALRKDYATHQQLVEKHRLYWPPRVTFEGEEKIPPRPTGGAFWGTVGMVLRWWFTTDIRLAGPIRVRDLDLGLVQDLLGGELGGVTFVTRKELDQKAASGDKSAANANMVTSAELVEDNGYLDAKIPDLRLAAINLPIGTSYLRAADSELTGLDVTLTYPPPGKNLPPTLRLRVGTITLRDVTWVSPSSMIAINELAVAPLGTTPGMSIDMRRVNLNPAELPGPSNAPDLPILGFLVNPLGKVLNLFSHDAGAIAPGVMQPLDNPQAPMELDVQLGKLDVKGITTSGGQSIGSASLSGTRLRGGQTPGAYWRALLDSLSGRLDRARADANADPARVTKLVERILRVRRRLDAIAEDEVEMIALQNRERTKPGSLDQRDQRRLDELQRAQRGGGLVLDVGEVTVDEIDGPWSGSKLNLHDVHADTGDDPVAALGYSRTTEGGIARYGAGASAAADKGIALRFELGDVTSGPQKYQPAIPSADELERRREKIEERIQPRQAELTTATDPTRRASLTAQLERLRAELATTTEQLVWAEQYQRLLDRDRLTEGERKKLIELRDKLRAAAAKASYEVGKIAARGLVIGPELRGSLGEIIADPMGALAGGTLDAEALALEKVKLGGATIGDVSAKNLSAGVTISENEIGLRLTRLDELTANTVDMTGPEMTIRAAGPATLRDARLTATLSLEKDRFGEPRVSGVHVETLHVGSLAATGLLLELAESGVRVELPEGALREVDLEGFDLALPEDKAAAFSLKSLGVGSIDINRLSAKLGETLAASGSLHGTRIDVTGVEESGKKGVIKVGDLGGEDLDLTMGTSRIRVTKLKGFSTGKGSITREGDTYTLKDLRLGELMLGQCHLETSSMVLDVHREAHLRGLHLRDGTAVLGTATDATGAESSTLDQLLLSRLHVDEIHVGAGKVVLPAQPGDPAKGEAATETRTIDLASATLRNVLLTGFDLAAGKGRIKVGTPKRGRAATFKRPDDPGLFQLDVVGLHMALGAGLDIGAKRIHGTGLQVDLLGAGNKLIKLGRTEVESATFKQPGLEATFSLRKLEGDVQLSGDKVVVSDLSAGPINLEKLLFTDGKNTIRTFGSNKSKVRMDHLSVDRITVRFAGGKLASLDVDLLMIDKITAGDITYEGYAEAPAPGAKASPDTAVHFGGATLNNVQLDKLRYTPDKIELDAGIQKAVVSGLDVSHLGKTKVASGVLTSFLKLVTNVEARGLYADLTMERAKSGDHPWQPTKGTATIREIGLTNVVFAQRAEDGSIMRVFANRERSFLGLAPTDPMKPGVSADFDKKQLTISGAKGTRIKVLGTGWEATLGSFEIPEIKIPLQGFGLDPNGMIELPGPIEVDSDKADPRGWRGLRFESESRGVTEARINKGTIRGIKLQLKDGELASVTIDEVNVKGGALDLDLAKMIAGGGKTGAAAAPGGGLDWGFTKALNGMVNLKLHVPVPVFYDYDIDTTTEMKDGTLDVAHLRKVAITKQPAQTAMRMLPGNMSLSDSLQFRVDGDRFAIVVRSPGATVSMGGGMPATTIPPTEIFVARATTPMTAAEILRFNTESRVGIMYLREAVDVLKPNLNKVIVDWVAKTVSKGIADDVEKALTGPSSSGSKPITLELTGGISIEPKTAIKVGVAGGELVITTGAPKGGKSTFNVDLGKDVSNLAVQVGVDPLVLEALSFKDATMALKTDQIDASGLKLKLPFNSLRLTVEVREATIRKIDLKK